MGQPHGLTRLQQNQYDGITPAAIYIDYPHHEAHEGKLWKAFYRSTASSTQSVKMAIRTSTGNTTKRAHMVFAVTARKGVEANIYKGSVVSSTGTTITQHNTNHNSTQASAAVKLILGGSTIGGTTGTEFDNDQFGSSATCPSGTGTVGEAGVSRAEYILDEKTTYDIRIASLANNNTITVHAIWYEKDTST